MIDTGRRLISGAIDIKDLAKPKVSIPNLRVTDDVSLGIRFCLIAVRGAIAECTFHGTARS